MNEIEQEQNNQQVDHYNQIASEIKKMKQEMENSKKELF